MSTTNSYAVGKSRSKGLNIGIWIAQVILALMMLMSGFMKISTPIAELGKTMAFVRDVPEGLVRFIGVVEILGAIGLLLPSILRIQPKLTVYAALGVAFIMILAIPFHISRGEVSGLPVNFAILLLAVFVAWGRMKKEPIASKS